MIHVCKDCTERTVGCHGSCEKYLRARAKQDLINLCRFKVEDRYPQHFKFYKKTDSGLPKSGVYSHKRRKT